MQSVWGWLATRFVVVAVWLFAVFAIAGSAYAAPQISAISPASGPLAGGNTITITGTDLQSVTAVNFTGVAQTDFTIDSATQITATVPAGVEGIVDITLSAGDYTSEPSEQGRYGYLSEASTAPADFGEPTATSPGAFGALAIGAIAGTAYAVVHDATSGDQAPPPAPPVVTGVSPAAGLTLGGTEVTITGSGFTGASAVSFGGAAAASFELVSDTTITAVAPVGSAGTVDLTVTSPGGTSAISAADHFTYYVPTVITSVSPSSGPTIGGTNVTVTGGGFVDVSSVAFGGVEATNFTVLSPSQIMAIAPSGTPGAVDLVVTVPVGPTTGTYTYVGAPMVSGIAPTAGAEAGGTTVAITGSSFTGATAVSFGATPAASFVVDSDSVITAVAPAGTGAVDVTVTTPGGTSAPSAADQFTYFEPPTITSISPTSGPEIGGTTVTLTGTGFVGVASVLIGGVTANFTVDSDTELSVVAPAGSAGAADVVVTTPGGSATAVGGYTYYAAPTLSDVLPSAGPLAGGTVVTLTGAGFVGTTSVMFGSTNASSFTVVSDTQIFATVSAHSAGDVDVMVTTPGGSATASAAFTYVGVPTITGVSPAEGPQAGGTSVTITGTNFIGVTSVTIGGVSASFSALAGSITVSAPAGNAGAADVVVAAAGGSATALGAFTYFAPPTITTISPDSGPAAGGTTVTIYGTDFTGATGVTFGGTPATSFTVIGPGTIAAVAPAGSVAVDVVVTTPGGSATMTAGYFYIAAPLIANVSPTLGSQWGGTGVTITGVNFSGVTGVSFGGAAATITANTPTSVTVTSPAGTEGAVDVTVTTAGGSSTVVGGFTYVGQPVISTLSPAVGPTFGGQTVTIEGVNFANATSVTFDGAAATVTANTATSITVTSPAGVPGLADVQVTTAGGSATAVEIFTYVAAPEIGSISPTLGSQAGGTSVTINGTNFTNATSVTFGGAAATITANTPTSVTATSPAGTAGAVDVTLTTPGGSSTAVEGFTYVGPPVVTSLSATQGSTSGGETITVSGSGFTEVTGVSFGGSASSDVTFVSDNQVKAVSPGGVAGTVDVTVTTPSGTSATSAGDKYTLFNAPMFSGISPSQGPVMGGATVVLTGSGFTGASSVTLGGVMASFVVDNDSQITAVTPAGMSPGAVDVVVTGPAGSATAVGSYVYLSAPGIGSISPTSGPVSGGTTVTINGVDLSGVTSVSFGGAAATITGNTPTSVTVTSPPGTAGAVDVTVTTAGGSDTNTDGFTYGAAPVVTAVSPGNGPELGGTTVTITGTGFVQATAVNFGATPASFTIVNDTAITTTAPTGSGTVDVTVVSPNGTSDISVNDHFVYVPMPLIYDVSPSTGTILGGEIVTITGVAVDYATSVTFGGVLATSFTAESSTTLQVVTPAGTAGPVDVVVTSPGGNATLADGFTYVAAEPAPFARAFSPLGLGLNGSVTIKQATEGGDSVFTFTSPTPELNVSVTTSGGAGQSAPVSLPPGAYTVTAARTVGFGLTSITCDDGDSFGDHGGQRASVTLAAGENVSCTFTSFASQEATTGLIQNFLAAQGSVILANLPGEQRRIDRLNGVVDVPGNPVPVLMGYLPQAAEDTLPLPTVSASLAEIDAITGRPKSPFDAWFQATLGTFGSDSLSGGFGIVSLGADYLISPDALVGGFVQVDVERADDDGTGGTISGTGWIAGPYATIRLSNNVYLDLLAGAGVSSNSVTPDGTYTDDFDATRWLVSGSLTGQWQIGDWTFLPTASLSYFQSTSEGYLDSIGVDIPSVTGGLGQATLGPKVSYSFDLGDGIHVQAGVGLDGVLEVATDTDGDATTDLHGRVHAGLDFSLPGGATLGVSGTYDGIGSPSVQSASGKVNFSMPIN